MVIIVSGAIAPDPGVRQLTIRDNSIRLAQYKNSLEKLILAKTDAKIVFCDNSGYGTEAFESLNELARQQGVQFETLSFKGDNRAVIAHGKGYGEGEIIKFVLANSKLAAGEEYMVKMTGRLVVDNIADIVRNLKTDRVYFNVPNIHRRDIYDTRLYAMSIKIFNSFFIDEYKKVDDDGGYILENVYTDVIRNNHLKVRNFPRYPRIVGQSGSGGIAYEYTEWKCKIRDILGVLNLYGRVEAIK